jgi:transcriptional regulator
LSSDNNTERERKVLELYNQGKTTREIAKEQRLSLRDISLILKKHGVNHGIVIGDGNKKSSNEKATQAYKLFSEGKKPVQVAIELNLREGQVNKFFREFWKLKNLNGLYELYPQIQHCLPSFLKEGLHYLTVIAR